MLTDTVIDMAKDFRGRTSHVDTLGENDIAHHHEQGTRNTLTGYVADQNCEMILI